MTEETVITEDPVIVEALAVVEDPNRVVRHVCIDGHIREANAEELASILEIEIRAVSDALAYQTALMRQERNRLLADSDWVELPSAIARLTGEQFSAWMNYRQELRDVPAQEGFPDTIIWPTQPA
jgi:hypothetical protein